MVELSVVYGREIDGEEVTFGTTGYTMNSTFVLYDRKTESIWYPMSPQTMDATSGPYKGKSIAYEIKPKRMSLDDWRAKHPDTLVLIPPGRKDERRKSGEFKI